VNILVTGGAGYIGSRLLRTLAAAARRRVGRVRVLDNMREENGGTTNVVPAARQAASVRRFIYASTTRPPAERVRPHLGDRGRGEPVPSGGKLLRLGLSMDHSLEDGVAEYARLYSSFARMPMPLGPAAL